MRYFIKRVTVALLISAVTLPAMKGEDLPLNIKRLSERALVVWVGDLYQTIGVVALATEKGIVTIDANLIRSHDFRIKKAIGEEFGRNDFKYLINTHYHHDHTGGNQAYADAEIIAHKNCPAGMKQELTGEGLADLVGRFRERLKVRRKEIREVAPGSERHKYFSEEIDLLGRAVFELENGFVPTYPTILFEKNMTLDMGDMTLELYRFGNTHTNSDIIVFVPEEGLVALGDLVPGVYLPYVRPERMEGFPVMMEHWGKIIDSGIELKFVTMAHWDMPHSPESFREQYRYLRAVLDGLTDMQRQGKTIEEAGRAWTIEEDFPFFKDKRTKIRDIDLHRNNIEVLWEWLAGKKYP